MASLIPFPSRRNKDPFLHFKRDINRLFEDLLPSREMLPFFSDQMDMLNPDIDVSETNTEVLVQAELPGIDEKVPLCLSTI